MDLAEMVDGSCWCLDAHWSSEWVHVGRGGLAGTLPGVVSGQRGRSARRGLHGNAAISAAQDDLSLADLLRKSYNK